MTYQGTVQNGVVVFDNGLSLPDGTVVTIVIPTENATPDATPEQPTIWQKLSELGRQVESEPCDLPSDLAANHDHYLHGLPKRQ